MTFFSTPRRGHLRAGLFTAAGPDRRRFKGSSTTTSQSGPPPQVMSAYTNLINQATAQAAKPLQQYTGPMVAGFTPTQQNAFTTINNAQGTASPYINSAVALTASGASPITPQTFNPNAVGQYMSPYTQNVVNATEAQFANTNAQQQNALTGNAISHGAWGGDRAGVASAALSGQQQLSEAPTIAGLENQNYSQALQEFNQQQQAQIGAQEASGWLQENAGFGMGSLGNEALNTTLTGANAQLGIGSLQQQLAQENLNVPYEQYLQQQAYPYQNLSWLGGLTEGIGSQMGGQSSTTTPPPNSGSQIAGGVMDAAAIAGLAMMMQRGGRVGYDVGGAITTAPLPAVPNADLTYIMPPSTGVGPGPPSPPPPFQPQTSSSGSSGMGLYAGGRAHYDIGGGVGMMPLLPTVPDAGASYIGAAPAMGHGAGVPAPPPPVSPQTQGGGNSAIGSGQLMSIIDEVRKYRKSQDAANAASLAAQGSTFDQGAGALAAQGYLPNYRVGGRIRAAQGGMMETAGAASTGMTGTTPFSTGMYGEFSQMPTEKLQELAVRLPPSSPYGRLVQEALAVKHMNPTAAKQQLAVEQMGQAAQGQESAGSSPFAPTSDAYGAQSAMMAYGGRARFDAGGAPSSDAPMDSYGVMDQGASVDGPVFEWPTIGHDIASAGRWLSQPSGHPWLTQYGPSGGSAPAAAVSTAPRNAAIQPPRLGTANTALPAPPPPKPTAPMPIEGVPPPKPAFVEPVPPPKPQAPVLAMPSARAERAPAPPPSKPPMPAPEIRNAPTVPPSTGPTGARPSDAHAITPYTPSPMNMTSAPASQTPAPQPSVIARFEESPWLPVLVAGATMMAGTSPYGLVNVGNGIRAGVGELNKQLGNEQKQQQISSTASYREGDIKNKAAQLSELAQYHRSEIAHQTQQTNAQEKQWQQEDVLRQKQIDTDAALRTTLYNQSRYSWSPPAYGPDPKDPNTQILGSWRLPMRGNEAPIFFPGVTGRESGGAETMDARTRLGASLGLQGDDLAAFAAGRPLPTQRAEEIATQRAESMYASRLANDPKFAAEPESARAAWRAQTTSTLATQLLNPDIGVSAPPEPQTAPAPSTPQQAPRATPAPASPPPNFAFPARPAAVPDGASYSPSQKAWWWKKPDGTWATAPGG